MNPPTHHLVGMTAHHRELGTIKVPVYDLSYVLIVRVPAAMVQEATRMIREGWPDPPAGQRIVVVSDQAELFRLEAITQEESHAGSL
jgi:hypothetical protein